MSEKKLHLQDAKVARVDYSGLKIETLVAENCVFEECRFEKLSLNQACFGAGSGQSTYRKCSFDKSKISAVAAGNARFEACLFSNVRITKFIGLETEFINCIFSGQLSGCVFSGSIDNVDQAKLGRERNAFLGNDFVDAGFNDVAFRGGINLAEQRLPNDSRYRLVIDGPGFVRAARERYLGHRDLSVRQKIFSVLSIIQYDIDEGQDQLFVSADNFPKQLRSTAEELLQDDSLLVAGGVSAVQ